MTPAAETRAIIAAVASAHGCHLHEVLGPSRLRCIVAARKEAIRAVAEKRPHWSVNQIARAFGLTHWTVLWHLGRLDRNKAA